MIHPILQNPRKKQRSLWIEDKIWEIVLSMKNSNQSISKYFRQLILKEWESQFEK